MAKDKLYMKTGSYIMEHGKMINSMGKDIWRPTIINIMVGSKMANSMEMVWQPGTTENSIKGSI